MGQFPDIDRITCGDGKLRRAGGQDVKLRQQMRPESVGIDSYSNTCWSMIAPDDNAFVGGGYEPGDGKIKQTSSTISKTGEDGETRKQNYQASLGWYAGIVSDVFG